MIRLQRQRHALGSEALVTLVGDNEAILNTVFEEVWQALHLFEHTFSRFLPDSELTYVNEQAGLPTNVSREFMELAEMARGYAQKTGGLYNPFVLPALQRAGYKGSWPAPTARGEAPDYSDRHVVPWQKLELAAETVIMPLGAALDFGGIGKGYALDELSGVLEQSGVHNYWISLGGDLLVAGHDLDDEPWQIEVAAAQDASIAIAVYTHRGEAKRAIATSGTIKRAGKGWNHLIDPRTGQSTASDILTATVAAETGTAADVYAKCLLLVGDDKAGGLAEELGVGDYVLQIRNKSGAPPVLVQKGLFQ